MPVGPEPSKCPERRDYEVSALGGAGCRGKLKLEEGVDSRIHDRPRNDRGPEKYRLRNLRAGGFAISKRSWLFRNYAVM